MEELIIDFGKNLKKYRKNASLSRQELGELIAYSAKSVEKWELGGSPPPIATICKIAKVFGITVDRLVYGEQRDVKYLLAVDGGGTKTEFLLTDTDRNEISRVILGPSNPLDIGMDNTKKILEEGIRTVCHGVTLREVSAFVGLAGGMTSNNKALISEFLKSFDFACYANGSDTENVIELALEGGNGVAVIMGTGVIAFSQVNGKKHRIGGWGYHIDKGGSGYDLGACALYEALKYNDKRGGSKLIYELIENKLGMPIPDAISDIYAGGKSSIASFAPIVFAAYDRGDKCAENIIDENIKEVADIILAGLNFLPDKKGKVVICGGIVKREDVLKKFLKKHLGKDIKVVFSNETVVNGALMLADKLRRTK